LRGPGHHDQRNELNCQQRTLEHATCSSLKNDRSNVSVLMR
jgi:hypothetical protein